MRWYRCIGLLVATLAWAQYSASDDGRIVYFSSRPIAINGVGSPSRLLTWNDGIIGPAVDSAFEPDATVEALSTDGQLTLIRLGQGRWQLFRYGAATPIGRINFADAASMSRNGRWLVVASSSPQASITRLEILPGGTRIAQVLEGHQGDPLASIQVFDDGTVAFPCQLERSCFWDGSTVTEFPGFIGPGQNSRFLYYWSNPGLYSSGTQVLSQYDRVERKTIELGARCGKVEQRYYSPSGLLQMTAYRSQASIRTSVRSGTQVMTVCGGNAWIVNAITDAAIALPNGALLNSTFTRILSRPTPSTFAWAPLGTAVPPLDGSDSVTLTGIPAPGGILTTVGEPDFQINWGGQTLPWLKGAHGYFYAPLPPDLVPSAVDSVTLTSAARPWLDTTIRQTVQSNTPTVLPLVAADPRIAFIHGDYRGFLTPGSYATRGDYLHFLISGVDPAQVTLSSTIEISYNDPSPGLRPTIRHSFPLVALSPTTYHPNISQVTFRIPDDARSIFSTNYSVTCTFEVTTPDGRTTRVQHSGYLVYDRPAFVPAP